MFNTKLKMINSSIIGEALEKLAPEPSESLLLSEINRFIEILARVKPAGNVFNQYSYELSINSIRRSNLSLYFKQMVNLKPRLLLVGEAPGYRGCRLTGVPFTSEYILLKGLEEPGLFGEYRGYCKTNQSERVWKESSASIVWQTLATTTQVPLIWNAFPFHPFQPGNEQSNRKPCSDEVKLGQAFLKDLIQIFDIEIVVAVGNTAESALKDMTITHRKVRHPAHGGKTMFVNGINAVMDMI
jgi:uracil-DNA glycosylase